MTDLKDELWPKFKAEGEAKVRGNIASGIYGERKQRHAEEWLRQREEERKESSQRESLRIARSAKNAAWAAVIIATIAIAVSIVSLVTLGAP